MANQAIALGIRAPQAPDLGRPTAQLAQLANMMAQQRAAERQAAQAQQRIDIDARLAQPQFEKATSEAQGASVKTAMEFNNFIYTGLSNANDPQQAATIAQRIAAQPQFSSPLFQGAIADALQTMPQDPAQFAEWRDATLAKTMDSNKRLERDYMQQNLGTTTRVISAPKFGRGPAEVLPGSEATVNLKPTVVNVEGLGPVIVDPNTGRGYPAGAGATGGYTPPGLVTGTRGGAAPAGGGDVFGRMIGIESGGQQFGKTGAPLTSPKGAVGIAQVMPGTAPEAAALAGLPYDENRYRTDAQYNLALGKAYYEKQLADFGDERLAAAAYNAGPGAVRRALQKGGPDGWINYVPRETQKYVAGVFGGGGRAPSVAAPGAAPQNVEQAASAVEKQRKVKTFQDLTGVNLETGEDPVAKLIRGSTSGAIEAFGANLMGAIPEQFGGGATPGMENIGKLEALASTLTLAFAPGGRLSTGVSNEDRAKIEQQLGKIEDPNIPAGKRLAAWQEVKAIMARTIGVTMKSAPTAAAGRPKPTPADVAGVRRNRDKREWTEGFRRQFGDEALRKALGGR